MAKSVRTPTTRRSTTEQLIELGRDREALAVATRGGPMDGVEQLDQIGPMLMAIVDAIGAEQLDAPTPCAHFTVEGVLEHMISGATAFAPAFRGDTPATAAPTEGTPQEAFGRALAELAGAVHAPGAQERTIASPFGDVPGSFFARYVAFDGLAHGWDLATATGQRYAPDETLVAEIDTFAREFLKPEMRDGDTFAAETEAPPGSSRLEQLMAFSGRRVNREETQR